MRILTQRQRKCNPATHAADFFKHVKYNHWNIPEKMKKSRKQLKQLKNNRNPNPFWLFFAVSSCFFNDVFSCLLDDCRILTVILLLSKWNVFEFFFFLILESIWVDLTVNVLGFVIHSGINNCQHARVFRSLRNCYFLLVGLEFNSTHL